MQHRRRVLFIGEASYLATGFSTYWNEVIKRIHAMDLFEIAELGSYAHENDPRNRSMPWKFYPVGPRQDDAAAMAQYGSRATNQFGEWRFDDVLLDFKPDIVCGLRDWWMDEFVLRSPFRDYYKFIWMPTIDGAPQRDPWIDSYRLTDTVLTYSQYGFDLLKKEGDPSTNLVAVASPGADLDVFKPAPDKNAHKTKFGVDPNVFIVGTVMRNQQRKLYVDLIEAFAQWLQTCKSGKLIDIAKRTYLYLHTSYPDVGYDIGKAIQRFKIGSKVLMTYLCAKCGVAYPAFFSGEWTNCRKCGQPAAHPPNANHSVPREVLAQIMNLFDVYVQYSICEGWGMPCTESMACGVPVMAVNYSAMEDHCRMPGGIPINVERFFYEPVIQTEQKRALPDNQHFGEQLTKFLRMKPEQRQELARRTVAYVEQPAEVWGQDAKLPRFGWDRAAQIWANVIQAQQVPDPKDTWLSPEPRLVSPNLNQPKSDMSNTEFVRWAIRSVLCQPKFAKSYLASEYIRALNCGFRIEGGGQVAVDRETILNNFLGLASQKNAAEQRRVTTQKMADPDAIVFKVI